jgi:dihydrofolate reductase
LFEFLKETNEDIFVIGGKTIYQLCLPYADRLIYQLCFKTHEGNVYFPKFDLSQFKLIEKRMEEHLIFAVYERVSP